LCCVSKDVNMDELRGKSKPSSQNSSRESSVHSDLSSVPYVDRMEAQNPPGQIKWKWRTFNCHTQLPRRGCPMFRMRLTVQMTCLPHMWKMWILVIRTWINLMALSCYLFLIQNYNQLIQIYRMANQILFLFLEPQKPFIRTWRILRPHSITLQTSLRIEVSKTTGRKTFPVLQVLDKWSGHSSHLYTKMVEMC